MAFNCHASIQQTSLNRSGLRYPDRVSSSQASTFWRGKGLRVDCAKCSPSPTLRSSRSGQSVLHGTSRHAAFVRDKRSSLCGAKKLRHVSCASVPGLNIDSGTLELIEGNLFAASLFPYLGFLYHLKKSKAPELLTFGFTFLLVFVFGTIPAAIYAKVQYNDVLANVDWLHGPAESLLTITNLFIVLGARKALREKRADESQEELPAKVGQQQEQ
eukprot:CAMPEP_0118927944 /NCGR_PEP_ID=MMETSP1169-20130426/5308_1 /TAXON_ID=36882 /ORGANISM="Pyramimonas obovata, Strain CCMP722" /LENGTH=214 /DNA_ID=CAMNT_0006869819 /DNA_START=281 /DNA_END=925 /DNA_ORIENTATION=-